jgi:hypothetical protein
MGERYALYAMRSAVSRPHRDPGSTTSVVQVLTGFKLWFILLRDGEDERRWESTYDSIYHWNGRRWAVVFLQANDTM